MQLSPWLAMQLTKQLRDLAALPRGTWEASSGKCLLYLLFNSSREMEAARTIETSVITWHKRQERTLNIYRRPNPYLKLIRCLCVAVSLYYALQAVVPRYRTLQVTRCRSHWPRGLRRSPAPVSLLRLCFRNPPTDMDVCLTWVLCVVR
jgi:hypothetical protein